MRVEAAIYEMGTNVAKALAEVGVPERRATAWYEKWLTAVRRTSDGKLGTARGSATFLALLADAQELADCARMVASAR